MSTTYRAVQPTPARVTRRVRVATAATASSSASAAAAPSGTGDAGDAPSTVLARDVTSFLVSTLIHFVGLVVAGLIVIGPPNLEPQIVLSAALAAPQEEAMEVLQEVTLAPPELEAATLETAAPQSAPVEFSAESLTPAAPLEVGGEVAVELGVDFGAEVAPVGDLLASTPPGRGARGGSSGLGAPGGGQPWAATHAEFAKRLAVAGGKSGPVQATLIWHNVNDLDLHFITPAGEHLFFGNRRSQCRGELDVDRNASGPETREPVENIYWPPGQAPLGKYVVLVHHFARHSAPDPTPFELLVWVDGRAHHFRGVLHYGEPALKMFEFTRTRESLRQPAAPPGEEEFPLRESFAGEYRR